MVHQYISPEWIKELLYSQSPLDVSGDHCSETLLYSLEVTQQEWGRAGVSWDPWPNVIPSWWHWIPITVPEHLLCVGVQRMALAMQPSPPPPWDHPAFLLDKSPFPHLQKGNGHPAICILTRMLGRSAYYLRQRTGEGPAPGVSFFWKGSFFCSLPPTSTRAGATPLSGAGEDFPLAETVNCLHLDYEMRNSLI